MKTRKIMQNAEAAMGGDGRQKDEKGTVGKKFIDKVKKYVHKECVGSSTSWNHFPKCSEALVVLVSDHHPEVLQ